MKKWIALSIAIACVCGSFLTVAPAASGKKAAPPKFVIKGEVRHRFLASSYRGKVFIVGKDGKVEWEYKAPSAQDVFMLKGNRVLFNTRSGAMIVNVKDNKILWEYKSKDKGEIHSWKIGYHGVAAIDRCGRSANQDTARCVDAVQITK